MLKRNWLDEAFLGAYHGKSRYYFIVASLSVPLIGGCLVVLQVSLARFIGSAIWRRWFCFLIVIPLRVDAVYFNAVVGTCSPPSYLLNFTPWRCCAAAISAHVLAFNLPSTPTFTTAFIIFSALTVGASIVTAWLRRISILIPKMSQESALSGQTFTSVQPMVD